MEKAQIAANGDYETMLIQSKLAKKHYLLGQFKQYEVLMEEALMYFYKKEYWFDLLDIAKEFGDYQLKIEDIKKHMIF
ncbi:MAG: hypothetical protein LRY73_00065 [Bacillus sp. (in: Bacteria)]|nr:hypothetical protein [Bacillus sp. (in: firmicutes)]